MTRSPEPTLPNSSSAVTTGTRRTPRATIDLSVIIPMFNEVDNVEPLYEQLTSVLEPLGRPYEVVIVDDGSTDGTFEKLRDVHRRDRRWRIIRLRRNFGQTAGFSAGFEAALGEVVVTMDGDLQNDPADIPKLLDTMDEGFDIVSGWRTKRKEPLLTRRLPSMIANRIISKTTGVSLHDYGCSLKGYRREILRNVKLYGELHRFIPAIASWQGTRITEIPVNDRARVAGTTKYGLFRVFKVVLDILLVRFLLGYATRPFLFFGALGGSLKFAGTALLAYLAYVRFVVFEPIANRPLLTVAFGLVLIGIQIIGTGLLAEMGMRTYYEAVGQTPYRIAETLDANCTDADT